MNPHLIATWQLSGKVRPSQVVDGMCLRCPSASFADPACAVSRSTQCRMRSNIRSSVIVRSADERPARGPNLSPAISADKLLLPEPNRLTRYGDDDAFDAHCSRCGSLLCSMVQNGAFAHVTLGTLVDEPLIRPSAHIFTASKASWDLICDDLPQFEALPPE